MRYPSFLLLALSVPSGAAFAQTVRTVDDDGPADHATIQAAIDASSDGDVVLVRTGSYAAFTVDGRSVDVEADGLVTIEGTIERVEIRNLAAGQRVSLRGLVLAPEGAEYLYLFTPPCGLWAENNEGTLWIEDCVVAGPAYSSSPTSATSGGGASFDQCASIVAVRSAFVGQVGGHGSNFRYHGIDLIDSTLILHESSAFGGDGEDDDDFGDSPYPFAPDGGNGIWARGSSVLFTAQSEIRGGDGGDGLDEVPSDYQCNNGGYAGHGILSGLNAAGSLEILDSSIVGGTGGEAGGSQPPSFPCAPGGDASGIDASEWTEHPGSGRSLELASPVRESESFVAELEGLPGELVFLALSLTDAPAVAVPDWVGPWTIGAPFALARFLGLVPATGTTSLSAGVEGLPPGAGIPAFGQALFVDLATLDVTTSSPSRTVLLGRGL